MTNPLETVIPTFDLKVQTVQPMTYENSLSYYELLNKVIEQVNLLTDEVNLLKGQG